MVQPGHAAFATEVRTLHHLGVVGDRTDGQLLADFVSGTGDRREAAFTVLVERHGPMVLRVCGDLLGDREDSRDAAQATFLVLARRASSIRHPDSLGPWLFGVARRVAARARADAARRREVEREAGRERASRPQPPRREARTTKNCMKSWKPCRPATSPCSWPATWRDSRTPQAAGRLNLPLRTLQTRLYRGRERLRARLVRRGFTFAAVGAAPRASISALCRRGDRKRRRQDCRGFLDSGPRARLKRAVDWSRLTARKMTLIRVVRTLGLATLGLVVGGWVTLAKDEPGKPANPQAVNTKSNAEPVQAARPAVGEALGSPIAWPLPRPRGLHRMLREVAAEAIKLAGEKPQPGSSMLANVAKVQAEAGDRAGRADHLRGGHQGSGRRRREAGRWRRSGTWAIPRSRWA